MLGVEVERTPVVDPVRLVSNVASVAPPKDVAGDILRAATDAQGVDTRQLAKALDALPPAQSAQVRQEIDRGLSPVDRGRLAEASASSKVDIGELSLDLGQMALDVVGIFEPTPFADLTNAGISLFRGDGLGALLSAAGAIPYIGDAAKLGKLGKWAETVAKAVEAAASNPAARRLLEPALQKVGDALGAIPDSILSKLPADAQAKLKGLKSQVDNLANPIRREVSAAVDAAADRLGIPRAKLAEVADAERGTRPPVSSYMTASQQAAHLSQFDSGIVRVTSRSAITDYGTLGPPNGFVTSLTDFRAIMAEAKGDLSIVERRLSLDPGTLQNNNTVIAVIDRADVPNLRVPSGNEGGANSQWAPGGYTSQGTAEAVMDFPADLKYSEIKLK